MFVGHDEISETLMHEYDRAVTALILTKRSSSKEATVGYKIPRQGAAS